MGKINEHSWAVYALLDPRNGEVRYVGWASNLQRRLAEHFRTQSRERTHKANWIRSLKAIGLLPMWNALEEGSGDHSGTEKSWIVHFRSQGCRLTNMTEGGDGALGHVKSPELRKRMSETLKGRKRPREVVEKWLNTKRSTGPSSRQIEACRQLAAKNVGRKQSLQTIALRVQKLIGKTHVNSPETRAKISAANRGKRKPDGFAEKISAANKGKVYGPETREKIAAARRGKHLSEEHKEKLSIALRGRSLSAEHRAKLSASHARRNKRMAWLYVPGLEVSNWPAPLSYLDTELSVRLRERPVRRRSWLRDSKTYPWLRSLSGMTLPHLTVLRGVELFISSLQESHVNLGQLPEKEREHRTKDGYGMMHGELSAKSNPSSSSLKMSLGLYEVDFNASLMTLPKAGGLVNGCIYERPMWEHLIGETGYSAWPTARAEDSECCGNHPGAQDSLTGATREWGG